MKRFLRVLLALFLVVLVPVACTDEGDEPAAEGTSDIMPAWVEDVIPEPGAVATVAAVVEVDHSITATDEDIRLIVDGVDVTTYAAFDAGKLRYESGVGPVVLNSGDHTATVQRVLLRLDETQFRVLDSFSWEFGIG